MQGLRSLNAVLLVVRGLPRDTENNLGSWETLLVSVSSLCQHFPIVLKEFAIVYYVAIAPYNNKSSWRILCFPEARSYWRIFKGHQARFVH